MRHFYSVIIGTEILNGRRVDKHFDFINRELNQRGLLHVANLVVCDNPLLIQNCFNTILADPQSVMFCFGGIGATPDDLTRQIASDVFTGQPLCLHVEAQKIIEQQFGDEAYPHRINMAKLPPTAKLLKNVINNVPGFQLRDRFFFTPGFPSMSWPMVKEALDTFFPNESKPFIANFKIESNESGLIDIMEALPKDLGFSSLPRFEGDKRVVEIYLSHLDKNTLEKWTLFFKNSALLKNKKITDCL
ncbi:MAG: competence/damage-inducible protein A [Campylobacteraceae bacterium]|nr:competence/damage-inducible protein A [Campylobacteraceae bacterium]